MSLPDDCWGQIIPALSYRQVVMFERSHKAARQVLINILRKIHLDRNFKTPKVVSLIKYRQLVEIDTCISLSMGAEDIIAWINNPKLKTIRVQIHERNIESFIELTDVKNYKNIQMVVSGGDGRIYELGLTREAITARCNEQTIDRDAMMAIYERIISHFDISNATILVLGHVSMAHFYERILHLMPNVDTLEPEFGNEDEMSFAEDSDDGQSSWGPTTPFLKINNQIKKLIIDINNPPDFGKCESVTEIFMKHVSSNGWQLFDRHFPNLKVLDVSAGCDTRWCADIRNICTTRNLELRLHLSISFKDIAAVVSDYLDEYTSEIGVILGRISTTRGIVDIVYTADNKLVDTIVLLLPIDDTVVGEVKTRSKNILKSLLPVGTEIIHTPSRSYLTTKRRYLGRKL